MSEHDSHDDPALSALYRRAAQEEPSAQLDERVLVMARRHATRRAHRWWLPLSTAAVVMLAVSLLLRHQERPDELQREIATYQALPQATQPAPAEQAAEAALPAPAPALRKREAVAAKSAPLAESSVAAAPAAEAEKKAESPAEAMMADAAAPPAPSADMHAEAKQAEPALRAVTPQAAAGAPLPGAAVAEAPEAWLKRIEALHSRGELEAAKRELLAFRKAYPDHALPRALQALLPAVEK